MVCLIGTEDTRRLLRGIVQDAVSQKIGHFDPDTFLRLCQQLSNLSIDTLFLDIRCTSDDAIIKGVRMIRFHRSNTRIVLIAADREPGDPCISALVSLGVYDIVAFSDERTDEAGVAEQIIRLLNEPPNYANAARWHFSLHEADIQEKPEKKRLVQPTAPPQLEDFEIEPPPIRTTVIERLVGTATIAVAGVTRRTGSTHLSIALAAFLSRKNFDVACLELSGVPVFKYFHEDKAARVERGFHREADFYPEVDEHLLRSVFSQGYQFMVMDLGSKGETIHPELGRASALFLTMCPSEWDFNFLARTLDFFRSSGLHQTCNVVVNFADPDTFREIDQAFTTAEKEKLRIRFYRNPIQSNPFKVHPDQEAIFDECLSNIIPKSAKRRFKLF